MKLELQQKLYDEFPGWFDYLQFGIETGDGWFDLIHNLCVSLKLINFGGNITQIKEKFGTLRFYVAGATDEQWKLIEQAEEQSEFICEQCGKEGKLIDDGWRYTICGPCYDILKKERMR